MFAVAWWREDGYLHLARDRYGEVPLHYSCSPFQGFWFASEMKALLAMGAPMNEINWFPPGTYMRIGSGGQIVKSYQYATLGEVPLPDSMSKAATIVRDLVEQGTVERTISDVPVCTLLSGGIDSAAVAYYLVQNVSNLVAYTAVFDEKSRDLKMARLIAKVLNIELREVPIELPTASDLEEVVWHIEMPHKAQVEIGWACLGLARRMRADGFKVTFSGEGSDELWGSYGFAYHGIKKEGWYAYRRRLFMMQARMNFARCNKVFMAHSVECRLPFLNRLLANYAVRLTEDAVRCKSRPKAVLQEAFRGLLPDEVVDRPKLAFQDGMGIKVGIQERRKKGGGSYDNEFREFARKAARQGHARGRVEV